MIDGTGHSANTSEIPAKMETTMFKTFSAALLAVSVLAAPAFAAPAKTEQTPVTKSVQAPVIKAAPVKTSVLNANAKMSKHHTQHVRHHSAHKKMGAIKPHAKVSFKHASTTAKRG